MGKFLLPSARSGRRVVLAICTASLMGALGVRGAETSPVVDRIRELMKIVKENDAKIVALRNGPCDCGAEDHAKCINRRVCEPAEQRRMTQLVYECQAARDELRRLALFLKNPEATRRQLLEELAENITLRERELAKLRDWKQGLRTLIERMEADQNWREDLREWVKVSQRAQTDAIMASLNLLLDSLGDRVLRNSPPKVQEDLDKALCGKEPQLKEAGDKLAKVAAKSPELRGIAERLDRLTKSLKDDVSTPQKRVKLACELLKEVERGIRGFRVAVDVAEAYDQQRTCEILNIVQEALKESVLSSTTDKLFDELVKQDPSVRVLSSTRGLRFAADYGLAACEFRVAWSQVDSILGHQEDREAALTQLRQHMVRTTDEVVSAERELASLQDAAGNSVAPEAIQALARVQADRGKRLYVRHGGKDPTLHQPMISPPR